jgi:hypothetical protein
MTARLAAVLESEADVRWREWQARGAASDRRTAARALRSMLIVAAALVTWFAVVIAGTWNAS